MHELEQLMRVKEETIHTSLGIARHMRELQFWDGASTDAGTTAMEAGNDGKNKQRRDDKMDETGEMDFYTVCSRKTEILTKEHVTCD